jgi:predicted alpha/beta superfamily hydrolase
VGIYNSPDRLDEYSWSEKGQNYLKFIVTELKPFIDSKYKTLTDKDNTAIMGSSMGGLISFYAGWHYPDIFSMAGCLSSSFYFNNDKSIKQVENYTGHKKHVKFYIDHGEDGNVRGQRMFVELSKKGYVIGQDIDYFYAPGAEHNEKEWAARLERPLRFFFGLK